MKKRKRTTVEIIRHKDSPIRAKVRINGQEIHGVTAVRYEHTADAIPTLRLDMSGLSMDVIMTSLKVDELVKLEIR